jgi:hypothetical protein
LEESGSIRIYPEALAKIDPEAEGTDPVVEMQ